MPSGFFVCVESCPTTNNFGQFICEYEVQYDIDETLKAAAEISGYRPEAVYASDREYFVSGVLHTKQTSGRRAAHFYFHQF
jgi:hypothetical protein